MILIARSHLVATEAGMEALVRTVAMLVVLVARRLREACLVVCRCTVTTQGTGTWEREGMVMESTALVEEVATMVEVVALRQEVEVGPAMCL